MLLCLVGSTLFLFELLAARVYKSLSPFSGTDLSGFKDLFGC